MKPGKLKKIITILISKKNWYFDLSALFLFSYLAAFIFINSTSIQLQFWIKAIIIILLCSYIFGYVIQILNNVLNNNYYLPGWNHNVIKYIKQSGNWYLAYAFNAFIFYLIFLFITFLIGVIFYTLNYIYFKSSIINPQNYTNFESLLFHLFISSVIMPLTTINYSKNLNFRDAFKYKSIWKDFTTKYKLYTFDIFFAILCNRIFIALLEIRSIDLCFTLATLPFIYLMVNLSFALTYKEV